MSKVLVGWPRGHSPNKTALSFEISPSGAQADFVAVEIPAPRGKTTVSAVELSFKSVWRELSKTGWKSKKPSARSLDGRYRYIRPDGDPNGTEGLDYFVGEEAVLGFYAGSKSVLVCFTDVLCSNFAVVLNDGTTLGMSARARAAIENASEIAREEYARNIDAAEQAFAAATSVPATATAPPVSISAPAPATATAPPARTSGPSPATSRALGKRPRRRCRSTAAASDISPHVIEGMLRNDGVRLGECRVTTTVRCILCCILCCIIYCIVCCILRCMALTICCICWLCHHQMTRSTFLKLPLTTAKRMSLPSTMTTPLTSATTTRPMNVRTIF